MQMFPRGRAGLRLWSSNIGSFPLQVPSQLGAKEVCVSVGVNSITLFSPHSPDVWYTPLNCTPLWRHLSLPPDACGEKDCVRNISSGLSHSLVLSSSGRVFGIGEGYFGQTGSSQHDVLSEVGGLEGRLVKQVVCGLDHSLFLLASGAVLGCGWAADGQIGSGSFGYSSQLVPVKVGSHRVTTLVSCSDSSFAMTEQGAVLAWGNNEYGQLGVTSKECQLPVPMVLEGQKVMDGPVICIAAGGPFTAFLTSQGSVYLTGYDIARHSQTNGQMRKIHCGEQDGKVLTLQAGLNYLLGLTTSIGFLWGKLQLQDVQSAVHCHAKFEVDREVVHLTCGPLEVVATTRSNASQILNFMTL